MKGGLVYDATDEIGHRAVENIVTHYDFQATLFHLFGLDPQRVTFPRATGIGQLIEVPQARIVREILV